MHVKVFEPRDQYSFENLILSCYENHKQLESLHTLLPSSETFDIVNVDSDNRTWFHRQFYQKINSGWKDFEDEYRKFLRNEVVSVIGNDDFVFQARPTYRVQIPGNKSVGDFHKDSDYNHQIGEINFVIALTDMKDTSAIWTESSPGKGDYFPVNVKKNQFFSFDGNMCMHGNKINETKITRVSLDFRILPISMYDPQFSKSSVTVNNKMVIGEYYDVFK